MVKERMLELVLLTQLGNNLNKFSDKQFDEFKRKYNLLKMEERSKELIDEFLSDYAME